MDKILLSLAVLLLSLPCSAEAHGTQGWLKETSGICVVAQYDDGEPMSYAQVEIAAPDGKPGFQSGRTDCNGMFMFLPDVDGKYRVTVGDDMGHQLVLAKTIAADGSSEASRESDVIPGASAGKWNGILGGLGVIFGFGGIIYGWRQKRMYSKKLNVEHVE